MIKTVFANKQTNKQWLNFQTQLLGTPLLEEIPKIPLKNRFVTCNYDLHETNKTLHLSVIIISDKSTT